MIGRSALLWSLWLLAAFGLATWLGAQLFSDERKDFFLIGDVTQAHQQIESACSACHAEPFGGPAVLQDACMNCHGEQLRVEQDSHPRSKFIDPRNADTLARLDARFCVTCHREHDPRATGALAVTQPRDLCFHCHQDIATERPSHAGMSFDSCGSAGCHNFHDNRALYEDFLTANAAGDWLNIDARIAAMTTLRHENFAKPAMAPAPDLPARLAVTDSLLRDFGDSAHAGANMGCASCHGGSRSWSAKPGIEACASCHEAQQETFLQGKHGMRLAQDLPPMTPALSPASHPSLHFAEHASDRELTCSACHDAHGADVRFAAVDACLGCHADGHSLAFRESPHGGLWRRYEAGELEQEQAVSCATCHLPRVVADGPGQAFIVTHNQNANLRPNEKMIRPVCMNCHGLSFALDALADAALVSRNFAGRPARHVESIDMALERLRPAASPTSPPQGENP